MEATTLRLILTEQKRIGSSVAELSGAVHGMLVENAKMPDKVRAVIREEMPMCPAFQYFETHRKDFEENTKDIDVQAERVSALRDKLEKQEAELSRLRNRLSVSPPHRVPWYPKLFIPVATALAGAITAGTLSVKCSTDGHKDKVVDVADTVQAQK